MPPKRGLFITLEGGEGVGKSTLLEALTKELTHRGCSVVKTREPGGSTLAEKIRQLLLHGTAICPKAELLLFLAARAQHVHEKIAPALTEGSIVICDRFSDSTIAYQAFARGLPLEEVEALEAAARDGIKPDITLLLDIDPEEAFKRIHARGKDRLEKEGRVFHKKVREGFLFLAEKDPGRVVVLDAKETPSHVLEQALQAIEKRL